MGREELLNLFDPLWTCISWPLLFTSVPWCSLTCRCITPVTGPCSSCVSSHRLASKSVSVYRSILFISHIHPFFKLHQSYQIRAHFKFITSVKTVSKWGYILRSWELWLQHNSNHNNHIIWIFLFNGQLSYPWWFRNQTPPTLWLCRPSDFDIMCLQLMKAESEGALPHFQGGPEVEHILSPHLPLGRTCPKAPPRCKERMWNAFCWERLLKPFVVKSWCFSEHVITDQYFIHSLKCIIFKSEF